MFRFKTKIGTLKINDLNIVINNKEWTYLDDEKATKSKDIKDNVEKLIVETDNDKYKTKNQPKKTTVVEKEEVVVEEENKMFTVSPKENNSTKSVDLQPKSEDITTYTAKEETIKIEPKNEVADVEVSVAKKEEVKVAETVKEEPKKTSTTETKSTDKAKTEKTTKAKTTKTAEKEINKDKKNISKIEKTSTKTDKNK